jgi:hypothetical protein
VTELRLRNRVILHRPRVQQVHRVQVDLGVVQLPPQVDLVLARDVLGVTLGVRTGVTDQDHETQGPVSPLRAQRLVHTGKDLLGIVEAAHVRGLDFVTQQSGDGPAVDHLGRPPARVVFELRDHLD